MPSLVRLVTVPPTVIPADAFHVGDEPPGFAVQNNLFAWATYMYSVPAEFVTDSIIISPVVNVGVFVPVGVSVTGSNVIWPLVQMSMPCEE